MTSLLPLATGHAAEAGPTLLSLLAGLLLVIVAARLAAEFAERIGQPTVLAEIAAGILIGPSVFNAVHANEVLVLLAEVGAILLLFEVGLHMNLDDLRRVGGDATKVGLLGIILPAAATYPIALAFGVSRDPAIFLAAAVTATSVGITARVFAEMRVLATPEARTVLGAAVVDDVLGLLILTFVTQTLGEFPHEGSIVLTFVKAFAFIIFGSAFAIWAAPRYFELIARKARTDGSMVIGTFAFALGIATLAAWAGLAPLVGAFLGGVAAARSDRHAEFQRRIAPLGHVIIPIFFVIVGLEVEVTALKDPSAILLALAISVAAIITKVGGGYAMGKGKGDRLLVGIGMVPRGEVGLIFASLGLTAGVLQGKTHASLILVVLITTVVTPPALRWRLKHRPQPDSVPGEARADGVYLQTRGRDVDLVSIPPADDALRIVLDAALAVAEGRPTARLADWLREAPISEVTWDEESREALFRLLRHGRDRSWRLLESSGIFATLFPRIAAEPRHAVDPYGLESAGEATWDQLLDLQRLLSDPADPVTDAYQDLPNHHTILLAGLARGAFNSEEGDKARGFAADLGVPWEAAEEVEELVAERRLLPAAALSADLGKEDQILELAAHLASDRLATALWILAAAEMRQEREGRARLDELHRLLHAALTSDEVRGPGGIDVIEARRRQVADAIDDIPRDLVIQHLQEAPRRYLLSVDAQTIALHLHLLDPPPEPGDLRMTAVPEDQGRIRLHIVVRDRRGVLAALATRLAADGYVILDASASVWETGIAILEFSLESPQGIDQPALIDGLRDALNAPLPSTLEPVEGHIAIDNHSSPWRSIVEVRAPNRAGLLGKVATAIASIGGHIAYASITTTDDVALDRFAVVGADGEKLGPKDERALRQALEGRTPTRRARR